MQQSMTNNLTKRANSTPTNHVDNSNNFNASSAPKLQFEIGKSTLSMSSNSDMAALNADNDPRTVNNANRKNYWMHNQQARSTVITAASAFYALLLSIFSFVFELSHVIGGNPDSTSRLHFNQLLYAIFMYNGSLVFLIYVYGAFLVHPRWRLSTDRFHAYFRSHSVGGGSASINHPSDCNIDHNSRVSHAGEPAGSLYLRLGCIAFGVVGVVYYAVNIFLCTSDYAGNHCDKSMIAMHLLALIFVFVQMHFVFCNWKLSMHGVRTIAQFGTMHLVAANLWTWFQYILIEEQRTHMKIIKISSNESIEEDECIGSQCLFGEMDELMQTAIIEYSLIATAVMFVVWNNIDGGCGGGGGVGGDSRPDLQKLSSTTSGTNIGNSDKRPTEIRIDCSKSTSGLFAGLAFLIISVLSMIIYYTTNLKQDTHTATIMFGCADFGLYAIAAIGCVYALWKMRLLHFVHEMEQKDSSQRWPKRKNGRQAQLDKILLTIGLVGELIYSLSGITGLFNDVDWEWLNAILIAVHVTRLIQVTLQSALLYIASKLTVHDDELQTTKPGKQAITFLLVANISLFFVNMFESEKAGINHTVINFYGKRSWIFLVRGCAPLTAFYRFHSSASFAEIWKNVYTIKSNMMATMDDSKRSNSHI